MAVTHKPLGADAPRPYIVTRALCVGGERVEVGAVLELTRAAAADMVSANKLAPYVAPEPAADPVPPAPEKPAAKAATKAAPAVTATQPELA